MCIHPCKSLWIKASAKLLNVKCTGQEVVQKLGDNMARSDNECSSHVSSYMTIDISV